MIPVLPVTGVPGRAILGPMRCLLVVAALGALAAGCGDNIHLDVDADPTCNVQIREIPEETGSHVPPGAAIVWSSNPPATGRHFFIWGRWNRTYTTPLPRGYWVHNLEHGGVALLYRCPDGCPDDVAALEAITAALPADSLCKAPIRTRTLITADPELPADVRIAASAWNWTYTASCVDPDSLRQFIADHYGHAPESLCGDGSYP